MERLLPAYPLFVKDPYFSLWAQTEILNEKDVIFWTGDEKKLYGYIKVDGEAYCFLGNDKSCKQAVQTGLSLTAFTTDYTFKAGKAELEISFVSPLPPDNLRVASCPVCYVNYKVKGAADAEIILVADQCVCYNGEQGCVRGGSAKLPDFEVSFFGLKKQTALSVDCDCFGADWGYWYLSGERSYYATAESCEKYIKSGTEPVETNNDKRKVVFSSSKARNGKIMLGFDDTVSINYFGDFLKGYYLENNTIIDALEETFKTSEETDKYLAGFDRRLRESAEKYGDEYINILYASLRQSVGAHKLVKDRTGQLLFLSKECRSNGCIGTVDVSFPSMPLYLLYNPELVRAMLRPIFKFAKMPVWKFDFAPHDVGTYPHCCGQVYGFNEKYRGDLIDTRENQTRFGYWLLPDTVDIYDFKYQMPVEECADILIMLAAAYKADGNKDIVREEFLLLEKWAEYLVRFGLKPENQLCTDDFSGHLKNNLNLAIKAVVGLGCFALLCEATGEREKYEKYRKIAEKYVFEIVAFSENFSHLPLTWDGGEDTYSLKYNLAFDKLLDLNLFSQEFFERETDFYLTKTNEYGIPLDNRAEFTKSDWLIWTACLTDLNDKRKKILGGIDKYLRNSEDRLPFGDWYETKTGRLIGFRNRTVQGGCFILLLTSAEKKGEGNNV